MGDMTLFFVAVLLAAATPLALIAMRHVIRRRRSSLIEELHTNLLRSNKPISTLEFARNKYGSAPLARSNGQPEPYLVSGWALLIASLPFVLPSVLGFAALFAPIGMVVGEHAGAGVAILPALLWVDALAGSSQSPSFVHTVAVAGGAFLGSYLFSLRMLLRATMNFELSPLNWLRAAVHMLTGVTLAIVLYRTFAGTGFFSAGLDTAGSLGLWLAFAFMVGWVPDFGVMELVRRLNTRMLKQIDSNALAHAVTIPIEVLDGIDYEVRYRLEEANISDVQNLATYNPILLFVETPYGLYETFDWVLQAQLCVIVGPERFLQLKRHNIRTVFDLERAVLGDTAAPDNYVRMIGSLLFAEASPQALKLLAPPTHDGAFDASDFDVPSIRHAVRVMLDDLHIHRLRQLWSVISEQLGREWLYQHVDVPRGCGTTSEAACTASSTRAPDSPSASD